MDINLPQIIDANINRISEGLRVIEEYTRFISKNKAQTHELAGIRKIINLSEKDKESHLLVRDTKKDMRANQPPGKRGSIQEILTANFKRAQEGLRVLEEYVGNPVYTTTRYTLYELEKDIVLHSMKKLINPGVYLITDDLNVIKLGIKRGVSLIQLRDKVITKQEFFKKALKAKAILKTTQIPFIVNDYSDIAHHIEADGFHSGQDDLDVNLLREMLGPKMILGRTTHTLKQGLLAQQQGADYVSVGPIYETPSKPGRPAIGYDYLKKAATKLSIPFVAIGGINKSNMSDILEFSPPLIGVVRAYNDIEDMLLARQ
ncbi:thiamine phosphate synthase [Thermoproteota archaeon]